MRRLAVALVVLASGCHTPHYQKPFERTPTAPATGGERNYREYRVRVEESQAAKIAGENAERERFAETRPGDSTLISERAHRLNAAVETR